MYRPAPTLRDRAGPLAAVVLLHIGIGYALLHLSGAEAELVRRADLAIFDVARPAAASAPAPATAARAAGDRGPAPQGGRGRRRATQHQERGDTRRRARTGNRHSGTVADRHDRDALDRRRADPGRGAGAGPGDGRGRRGHGNRQRRLGDRPRRRWQRPGRSARAARHAGPDAARLSGLDPSPLAAARRGVHHPARRARRAAPVVPRDALVRRRRDRCRDLPPGAGAAAVRARDATNAGARWRTSSVTGRKTLAASDRDKAAQGGSPSPRATPRWAR